MWVAILGMVAGCGFTDEQREYTLVGAATGGLIGGGIGTGVFFANEHDNWPAIPAGVAGGALIGGIIGYLLAPAPPAPSAPPPPPPPPPPPAPPPPPEKIVLRGVHFNFDKYYVRNVDKPVLDEAADTLKSNPNVKVYVNGYCDAIGSRPYNLRLSQRRAESVAAYLEDKGIPASQLIPQGFGKTHFVATNKTAEGRAENRRVELVPADQ
jgi:OmpA-OmpF porin, OOP family